jgi:hypothetical protein
VIDRQLADSFAAAAGPELGPESSARERQNVIAGALAGLGPAGPSAQIEKGGALSEEPATAPQLACSGADR